MNKEPEKIPTKATLTIFWFIVVIFLLMLSFAGKTSPDTIHGKIKEISENGLVVISEEEDGLGERSIRPAWIDVRKASNPIVWEKMNRLFKGNDVVARPTGAGTGWLILVADFDRDEDLGLANVNLSIRGIIDGAKANEESQPPCLREIRNAVEKKTVPEVSIACIGNPEISDAQVAEVDMKGVPAGD